MKGYARRVQVVLGVTLVLNLALAVSKVWAGWRANSLAVIGDGLHSGVDALANVLALVVLRLSTAPADEDHPFGHAKYETLAAFVVSGLLVLTGFELARAAVLRWMDPQETNVDGLTMAVMVVTLLVNLGVSYYETRLGRKYGSEILVADASQTRADVLVTLTVIAGLVLGEWGVQGLDPFLALVVSVFIGYAAYQVFRENVHILTDRVVYDPRDVARVVRSVPGVRSVHDIRSRGTAREAFVQMHLVVDQQDVAGAHAVADDVERRLADELGVKESFIHIEPEDDRSGPPGSHGEPGATRH